MIKIGVISDTHIPKAALDLPADIYNDFVGVDLILHAGDVTELSVLRSLEKLAPVKAVCGNMDTGDICGAYPKKEIIKIGRFRIGLIHGYGPAKGLMKTVRSEFDKNIDVIVFGHSHNPVNEIVDGILFFNPGSPTDKVFSPYNSYGILEADDKIQGRIIRI